MYIFKSSVLPGRVEIERDYARLESEPRDIDLVKAVEEIGDFDVLVPRESSLTAALEGGCHSRRKS